MSNDKTTDDRRQQLLELIKAYAEGGKEEMTKGSMEKMEPRESLPKSGRLFANSEPGEARECPRKTPRQSLPFEAKETMNPSPLNDASPASKCPTKKTA